MKKGIRCAHVPLMRSSPLICGCQCWETSPCHCQGLWHTHGFFVRNRCVCGTHVSEPTKIHGNQSFTPQSHDGAGKRKTTGDQDSRRLLSVHGGVVVFKGKKMFSLYHLFLICCHENRSGWKSAQKFSKCSPPPFLIWVFACSLFISWVKLIHAWPMTRCAHWSRVPRC